MSSGDMIFKTLGKLASLFNKENKLEDFHAIIVMISHPKLERLTLLYSYTKYWTKQKQTVQDCATVKGMSRPMRNNR